MKHIQVICQNISVLNVVHMSLQVNQNTSIQIVISYLQIIVPLHISPYMYHYI